MVGSARTAAVSLVLAACSARPRAEEAREPPVAAIDAAADAPAADAGVTDAPQPDPPDIPRPLEPEVRAQLEQLYEEHYAEEIAPAIRWLVARPEEARPPVRLIVKAMRVEPATGHAMEILGRIGDRRDVALLEEVLRHRDATETMRWDAAEALAEHATKEAEAALLATLDHPDEEVVDAAIFGLGLRRSEAARARLERMLDAPSVGTRLRVVHALGKVGAAGSDAALRRRAGVETSAEVKKALRTLGY